MITLPQRALRKGGNGTQMNAEKAGFSGLCFKHETLTDTIICCFYIVYNRLGYGFLEKVYENSLLIELEKSGHSATRQYPVSVRYDGQVVGEYFADIMVDDKVIVEVKAGKTLLPEHGAQLLNYLKGTDIEVGLLLNFGMKPEIRRKAFENFRK
jgi:GxxExxY protein